MINRLKNAVLIISIVMLASCGTGYDTHIDKENGFQIDYPSHWKDTSNADPRMCFIIMEDFEDSTDIFGEHFNISVFPHNGLGLEEIVDQNITMANQVYANLKIDRKDTDNENGIPYIQLKMPYTAENIELINKATFMTNDVNLYTITQIAEADKMEAYEPMFDDIINSFKWLEE